MAHPVPPRAVVLDTEWLTTLSYFALVELAERGAVPRTAETTMARQHIRDQDVETLLAIRERLSSELVSRFEDHYGPARG